ncbi:MAG TPA: YdcF family protein [Hanamia sp.]|nr:YdcF family protein [Hanamia sp.]
MHQFLSAILSYFLSPFNWIILLLIVAWIFRKHAIRKPALIIALCIFIVFGNKALFNLYVKNWQPKPVAISTLPVYSCGIVTGGFASPDAEANGYFNSASDRFIQAVKLFKVGKIKYLLISGGNGKEDEKSFREAAWVKSELQTFGIPDSVILIEDHSNNTKENAVNSKHLLDSLNLQPPFLLITSAYHIPRASLLFDKAGVHVDPFPCNYTAGRGSFSFWDLLPTPSTLFSWDDYLKETVGYWWYKIK